MKLSEKYPEIWGCLPTDDPKEEEITDEVARLEEENEALHILRDRVDWFTKPHREIFDGTTIRCELCEAWEKYEDALLAQEQT